jgi:hypothetical protein
MRSGERLSNGRGRDALYFDSRDIRPEDFPLQRLGAMNHIGVMKAALCLLPPEQPIEVRQISAQGYFSVARGVGCRSQNEDFALAVFLRAWRLCV